MNQSPSQAGPSSAARQPCAASSQRRARVSHEQKLARFASEFRESGLEESAIARLTCPIGIPALKGKAPEVIAVSVAAQLLQMIQDEPADG